MSRKIARFAALIIAVLAFAAPVKSFAYPSASLTITGSEQNNGGVWDSGTITIMFNGHSESVAYGQYSTPASIAAGFAAKFSQDPLSALPRLCTTGVCAKANGATITFQLSGPGPFSAVSILPAATSSFAVDTSSWPSPNSSTPTLICSPSTLYVGSSTTCSVGLAASATAQVQFTVGGQNVASAVPDSLGVAISAPITPSSSTAGTYTIGYTYPGDAVNAASSATTTVTLVQVGSQLPNQVLVYNFGITGYAPNGNITGYYDSVNGMWSNIQYDRLNRLLSAQLTPAIAGTLSTNFCWGYDSFGNRTSQVQSNQSITGDGEFCTPQFPSTATWVGKNTMYTTANQIDHDVDPVTQATMGAPIQYDPTLSGNVIADGMNGGPLHSYLYDAEDRICAVQLPPAVVGLPPVMYQYLYDAEGSRVAMGTIMYWSCDSDTNGFTMIKEYVLGLSGEQVSEFDGSGTWVHTNAYTGGQLIATFDTEGGATYANPALHYQMSDWLGNRRVQTNAEGIVEQTWQNLPFGELTPSSTLGATEQHFTGKERDTESGLDYFGARYFSSSLGRFMSPDWSAKAEPVPYSKLDDPQTLNLYSYVRNNPISGFDPDGHDPAQGTNNNKSEQGPCGGNGEVECNRRNGVDANIDQASANQVSLKAQQQNASSTSSGKTTTITHADGTVEVRTGTPAFRDNNPGNIHPGDFTKAHGQIGVDPGTAGVSGPFAVFENSDSGRAALSAMVGTPQVGSRTIEQEMKRYASSRGDNPAGYAAEIAGRVGVGVTTRISTLSPAQREIIVQAIVTHEGSAGTVRFTQP